MAEQLLSSVWYRVADLHPRLRSHIRVHRHRYRGRLWFVVQDLANGRFHRFTPRAHLVIGLFDGTRSVDRIFAITRERMGEHAPSQDAMIRLLAELHAADLLESDMTPDVDILFSTHQAQRRSRMFSRMLSPFAIQVHVFDPTPLLERTIDFVRPAFGKLGMAIWLAVVAPALVLAGIHFSALSEQAASQLPSALGVLTLWIVFPIVKTLHELGHAYATRAYGGEVHDMGLLFLVFTPVPYVDASSASAFPDRSSRVVVGAAGMGAELFLAAIALYVWLGVEPGLVSTLAFHTLLIGGVSTVAFNANPLLRFDGYYILADLLEIPNLRQRASACLGALLRRGLLGIETDRTELGSPSERRWLVSFALASFAYRIVIMAWIALFVLEWSLLIGGLLLAISAVGWVVIPLVRGLRSLVSAPALEGHRLRATGLALAGTGVAAFVLFAVPAPLRSNAEGVVWLPEDAIVRAAESGFVTRIVAVPGSRVAKGDVLIASEDPTREAEVERLRARIDWIAAELHAIARDDRVEKQLAREQLRFARAELERAVARRDALVIRAARAGTFVVRRPQDLAGRFVEKGQVLAHVVDFERIAVRTVIPQEDVRLVQARMEAVHVRLAEQVDREVRARVARFVPGASRDLPSAALGSAAGGSIPQDPRSTERALGIAARYQVELELLTPIPWLNAGGRAYLRFDLGSEPLGTQWIRRLRQLFLSRLHV